MSLYIIFYTIELDPLRIGGCSNSIFVSSFSAPTSRLIKNSPRGEQISNSEHLLLKQNESITPTPPQKILAMDKKNTALNVVQSDDIYNVYILYLKSDIVYGDI